MLLINPPTGWVRKSGNREVRKKSSSYQSSPESCWIKTCSVFSSTLVSHSSVFNFSQFGLIFFIRYRYPILHSFICRPLRFNCVKFSWDCQDYCQSVAVNSRLDSSIDWLFSWWPTPLPWLLSPSSPPSLGPTAQPPCSSWSYSISSTSPPGGFMCGMFVANSIVRIVDQHP